MRIVVFIHLDMFIYLGIKLVDNTDLIEPSGPACHPPGPGERPRTTLQHTGQTSVPDV
jgi:hypothetical protein